MKKLSLKECIISKSEILAAKPTIKLHSSGKKMVKLRGEWFILEGGQPDGKIKLDPETFAPLFKIGPYYVPIEPIADKITEDG